MSGPRWVFQKPFQNATGRASGMWGDPRLKTPDCSLRNQSISNDHKPASDFVFRQFDSSSEDENKPDPEAIKEEIFVHDLSIMEQLDEARSQIKNLQIAAKSRAETTVHYRCTFENQDRLFLETLENCQQQFRELYRQEQLRYKRSPYGTFERSRRYSLVNDLDSIHKKMTDMIDNQSKLLKQEYAFLDSRLTNIDSVLKKSTNETDQLASRYLPKYQGQTDKSDEKTEKSNDN